MRISDWSSDVCSSDLVLGDPEQHEIAGVVPVGLTELPERAADAVEAGGRHVHRAEAAVGSEVRRAELRRPPAGQRLALVAAGEEREAPGVTTACRAQPVRRQSQGLFPLAFLELAAAPFADAQQGLADPGNRKSVA